MSSLSAPSALNVGLNPYSQQQVTDNSASAAGNAATSVVGAAEQSASGQTEGVHHGHHHHGGSASGLQSQIQQAVTSALSDADNDSDPNQTIQTAIEQVLQNPASAAENPALSNQAPGAADQPGSPTFQQFLESQGVSLPQFKSDLTAAFQLANSTGNPADLSKAFAQLPPGSVVDESA